MEKPISMSKLKSEVPYPPARLLNSLNVGVSSYFFAFLVAFARILGQQEGLSERLSCSGLGMWTQKIQRNDRKLHAYYSASEEQGQGLDFADESGGLWREVCIYFNKIHGVWEEMCFEFFEKSLFIWFCWVFMAAWAFL